MTAALKNDLRNIELTPEFITKSDFDLQTIKSLSEYAELHGNRLIVMGGYAVEAHLGGRITRVHGDLDCVFVNLSNLTIDQVFSQVQRILLSENTRWKLEATKPDKVDWRENRQDLPFNNRRRLELKIHDGDFEESEYIAMKLIDSTGTSIQIYVIGIYPMLSEKIHKFYIVKDGVDTNKDRESSLSDIIDLVRLVELKGINKVVLLQHMAKAFFSDLPDKGLQKSKEEYEYSLALLDELHPIISKYLVR